MLSDICLYALRHAVNYTVMTDEATGFLRVQFLHTCPKSNVMTIHLSLPETACPNIKVVRRLYVCWVIRVDGLVRVAG